MARAIVGESELQREVLAGKNGRCSGYKRTDTFGHAREPFTWLSDDGSEDQNQLIADELRALQRNHAVAEFEVWEAEDEMWHMIQSGGVHVLYVEMDVRISKVRALLQWAAVSSGEDLETPSRPTAR